MTSCKAWYTAAKLLIRQNLVGMLHPALAKIADFLGDQPVAKAELRPPHLNHAASSRALARTRVGTQQIVIELTNRLDRLLQFLKLLSQRLTSATRSRRTLICRVRPPG